MYFALFLNQHPTSDIQHPLWLYHNETGKEAHHETAFTRRLGVTRSGRRGRRLAAMARAAAQRDLAGERLAQRMAQGGAQAAVAARRHRRRLCDAVRGGDTALHTWQPWHGR